jgi:hypothetical protein
MRVDILANDRASFVKPMAEGLQRMLKDLGADARLHYDGLKHLMLRQAVDFSSLRSLAGSTLRLAESRRAFPAFVDQLRDADVVVVVANVPGSFAPGLYPNIELLRERLPGVPIVNYDLHYLPTLDSWARFLLRGEQTQLPAEALAIFRKGKFGLERYDWYLMASVGTHVPLPPGPHPYSLIGVDLDDGSLYPDQQGHFQALIDFPQNRFDFPAYREIQLEAIRLSGVDHVTLDGSYTMDEIRAIYRKTAIYFLASPESFGLPICELQACGSLVFAADPHWPASHWLGDDYYAKREPMLSPNFVIYENDPEVLAETIRKTAMTFDPGRVRERFVEYQPYFFRGDREALRVFLSQVDSGAIHSRLHKEHCNIGRNVSDPLPIAQMQA